jgi:hypothetical protein
LVLTGDQRAAVGVGAADGAGVIHGDAGPIREIMPGAATEPGGVAAEGLPVGDGEQVMPSLLISFSSPAWRRRSPSMATIAATPMAMPSAAARSLRVRMPTGIGGEIRRAHPVRAQLAVVVKGVLLRHSVVGGVGDDPPVEHLDRRGMRAAMCSSWVITTMVVPAACSFEQREQAWPVAWSRLPVGSSARRWPVA